MEKRIEQLENKVDELTKMIDELSKRLKEAEETLDFLATFHDANIETYDALLRKNRMI